MSLVPSNPVRNVPQGGLPLVGGLLGGLQGTPARQGIQTPPGYSDPSEYSDRPAYSDHAEYSDLSPQCFASRSPPGRIDPRRHLIGCGGQERYEALLPFNPNRLFFICYTHRT